MNILLTKIRALKRQGLARRWHNLCRWGVSHDFVQSLAPSYAIPKLLVIEINSFFFFPPFFLMCCVLKERPLHSFLYVSTRCSERSPSRGLRKRSSVSELSPAQRGGTLFTQHDGHHKGSLHVFCPRQPLSHLCYPF